MERTQIVLCIALCKVDCLDVKLTVLRRAECWFVFRFEQAAGIHFSPAWPYAEWRDSEVHTPLLGKLTALRVYVVCIHNCQIAPNNGPPVAQPITSCHSHHTPTTGWINEWCKLKYLLPHILFQAPWPQCTVSKLWGQQQAGTCAVQLC